MHLDSTFDALSIGTNYKFQSIDKRVILGKKVDFSQFYKIFSYFFNRFNSRILTYPP